MFQQELYRLQLWLCSTKIGSMDTFKLMLVGLCCIYNAEGYGVQQVFPSNPSYSCPGPSLSLKCEFPKVATDVQWSAPGLTHISDSYPGHVTDNSMLENRVAYLHVNSSSDLKTSYRCIVIYPNSTSDEYRQVTVPESANLTTKLVLESVSDRSIEISWVNPHPECFNFSVSVFMDNVSVEETTHDVHYTISNLSPNTVYRVCVTARDGHGNTHSHWMHCANITTGMSSRSSGSIKGPMLTPGVLFMVMFLPLWLSWLV